MEGCSVPANCRREPSRLADRSTVQDASEDFRSAPFGSDAAIAGGADVAVDHHGLDIALRLRTLLQRPLPPEELVENTRMVGAPAEERDRLNATLLIGTLGNERLAIDVRFARRVMPTRTIHRVPHRSSELFAGICNVQGELLPVARLERVLAIAATEILANPADRRMVVLGDSTTAWVVTMDRIDGIRRFDSSTFMAPPATVSRALDGVTDALVPLEGDAFAARLDPTKLARALARCLS